ncbi:MAG TPA: glycosyltransferase [Terriglobales bacterium]|nr:glycosyltransferase [Terriglobales bacterium]
MDENPAVSVVIATYNRAHFLGQTLESICAQPFENYEVIVVDDGSTDGTRQLVEGYGRRIRYFYQTNRGPSAARNMGVSRAQAPWIAIQDSDDLMGAEHLAVLIEQASRYPQCGIIFGNGAYLDPSGRHRKTIIAPEKSRRLAAAGIRLPDLFDKSIVRLQAALISKKCYDAIGGHDESLRICMDLDLAFRLFMNFPMVYVDKVLFQYRIHEGNIGRNEELRLGENIRVIEKLLRDFPEARQILGNRKIARRLAYRYYRLAKRLKKSHDWVGARKALRQAIGHRPCYLKYHLYRIVWSATLR